MDISNISVNVQNSIHILTESGKNVYIDPLEISGDAETADYIFITHDHYDHFSVEDIGKILGDKTLLTVPEKMTGKAAKIIPEERLISVKPSEKYETDDFCFETVPAYNKLKPFHPKMSGWVGYILAIEGMRIYIAGDTDATKEADTVSCDIAMVPVGGFYTMDHKEAAKLINSIKPLYAIPTHYGNMVGSPDDGEKFKAAVASGIEVVLKLG